MGSQPDPQNAINAGMTQGAAVANEQQGYNTQAGIQSQAGSWADTYNPYGSITRTQTGTGPGGVPLYSTNVNLSPEQQALLNTLTGTKQTAGTSGSQLLDAAHYGTTDPSKLIGDATSGNTAALMKMQNEYLHPYQQTERDQLDTKLRNQGLNPGEPGYDVAMRQLDTTHGLVESQAAAQFEPEAYKQALQKYQLPAEMALTLAGFGAPTMPNQYGVQAPGLNIQPANITASTANATSANMDAYKAQQAQYSNMLSGAFGIPTAILGGWAGSNAGGAALTSMFSDEDLKENIVEIGRTHDDIPIKVFNYKWDDVPRMGVMAQDVEKVKPEAVFETESGYKAVDYVRALRGSERHVE